jgi:cytochrome c oxidase subunit 3
VPQRHVDRQSRLVLEFFVASAASFSAAAALAFLLVRFAGEPFGRVPAYVPAFAASTCLLVSGSVFLQRALWFVRRERQANFRRSLVAALIAGILFVGVQSYGLGSLLNHQDPREAQTGTGAFLFVFTGMHGLHFTIALLFLLFVAVSARFDRYDHEYQWGVIVVAGFWHLLGVAWLAILAALVISAR